MFFSYVNLLELRARKLILVKWERISECSYTGVSLRAPAVILDPELNMSNRPQRQLWLGCGKNSGCDRPQT